MRTRGVPKARKEFAVVAAVRFGEGFGEGQRIKGGEFLGFSGRGRGSIEGGARCRGRRGFSTNSPKNTKDRLGVSFWRKTGGSFLPGLSLAGGDGVVGFSAGLLKMSAPGGRVRAFGKVVQSFAAEGNCLLGFGTPPGLGGGGKSTAGYGGLGGRGDDRIEKEDTAIKG